MKIGLFLRFLDLLWVQDRQDFNLLCIYCTYKQIRCSIVLEVIYYISYNFNDERNVYWRVYVLYI